MPERNRLILIGGGVRSGKSAFALAYGETLGAERTFIATAQAFDEEMTERIGRHQAERGQRYRTVEAPLALAEALLQTGTGKSDGMHERSEVVVVDCLTLWLSNLLLAEVASEEIVRRTDEVIRIASERQFHTLFVTNEVGMGVVPDTPLGRRFRDLAGTIHQRFAAAADEIYVAMVGTLLRIRPGPVEVGHSPTLGNAK